VSRFHSYGIPDKLHTILVQLPGHPFVTDQDLSLLFAEAYPQLFTTLGYPLVTSGKAHRGPVRTLARYLNAGLAGMVAQLAEVGIERWVLYTPLRGSVDTEQFIYRAIGTSDA